MATDTKKKRQKFIKGRSISFPRAEDLLRRHHRDDDPYEIRSNKEITRNSTIVHPEYLARDNCINKPGRSFSFPSATYTKTRLDSISESVTFLEENEHSCTSGAQVRDLIDSKPGASHKMELPQQVPNTSHLPAFNWVAKGLRKLSISSRTSTDSENRVSKKTLKRLLGIPKDFYHLRQPGILSCIDKDLWMRYSPLKTSKGFSLYDGVDYVSSVSTMRTSVQEQFYSIIAGDEDSFKLFDEIYIILAKRIHPRLDQKADRCDMVNLSADLQSVNVESLGNDCIKKATICISRSVTGFRFAPMMKIEERALLNSIFSEATKQMTGHLIHMSTTDDNDKRLLQRHHITPKNPWLKGFRHWPYDRAVFLLKKDAYNTIIKFNFEEHVQIMTSSNYTDLKGAMMKALEVEISLQRYLQSLGLDFCRAARFGVLNAHLDNLGFGMTLGAKVRLPCLSHTTLLDKILDHCRLRKHFPGNFPKTGFVRLQTTEKFEYNEIDLLKRFGESLSLLTDLEKRLRSGDCVCSALPFGLKISPSVINSFQSITSDCHSRPQEEDAVTKQHMAASDTNSIWHRKGKQ